MEVSIAADVPEYPKTETIFDRSEATRLVIPNQFRRPEFAAINRWHVTEKIDGTNVRIALRPDGTLFFGGRTADAQIPPFLLDYMRRTFTLDKMQAQFRDAEERPIVLYGEGYGPRIQKGGGKYRSDVAVRLFDATVGGVWLEPESLHDIANGLGVKTCPVLATGATTSEAVALVFRLSVVARVEGSADHPHEGVVARSSPLMLSRMGHRVMWKLKARDYGPA